MIKKRKKIRHPGFSTRSIHHERDFAPNTGAVMPAIFQTSTFRHGNLEGFDYTRSGNPNFQILEEVLSSVEGCNFSTVFGSGVSAITAIVSSLQSGDLILCEENLYGCTVRLFEKVFRKFGIKVAWLDFSNPSAYNKIVKESPKMIWIESPTNPLLKIIDIKKICDIAKGEKIPVVVDNTFATSYIQKPLDLGATLSLTSTTKYINGHSDALGGAVSTNSEIWKEKMVFAQKALGLQPSPFDCWLITRGIKTLSIRLERQIKNAECIANILASHPLIKWVRYPYRADHPQYNIAKNQMKAGGAIVTASLKAEKEITYHFCKNLSYFTMAESLGGVESLICHPASMTHASVDEKVKTKIGIDDSLIRFSVGCEDIDDLTEDLQATLDELL
tara:strand:- start:1178 stop:2344 length:1167 start_codon:yes stop_codon:yes gene_type:complete